MRVLALCTFPHQAAATRFRLTQLAEPLADRGIQLTIRPYLDSGTFSTLYQRSELPRTAFGLSRCTIRRFADVFSARQADVVLVQREAMLFGPPLIEWLTTAAGRRPLVLDLDDATYVSYVSPVYGRPAALLKWPGKAESLIRAAAVVTCGSREVADHVRSLGGRAVVIPTVVDTERFTPRVEAPNRVPVLGWIGSHSTLPYLHSLLPALQEVARRHEFQLVAVSLAKDALMIDGVDVDSREWSLEHEVADFQSLDIGLYPLLDDRWSRGKSGLKAIQYMAVGIPFVATPIGVVTEIGEAGVTHLCASSFDEWTNALSTLLADPDLRHRMGNSGRAHVLGRYTVPHVADDLAAALHQACEVPTGRKRWAHHSTS